MVGVAFAARPAGATQHEEPLRLGARFELGERSRLADPRGSMQDRESAEAARDLLELAFEGLDDLGAPDQRGVPTLLDLDFGREADSAAADRLDQGLALAVVADRAPGHREQAAQRSGRHPRIGPERAAQAVLGQEPTAFGQEEEQQIHHQGLDPNGVSASDEGSGFAIQAAVLPTEAHIRASIVPRPAAGVIPEITQG